MDEPLVCCILPYHIPDYFEQAIQCFESQTYPNKQLIAVDTSAMPRVHGLVRNNLIEQTPRNCLIAHWDHDDWSCPTRLAEQVAFLKASGAAIVAYRDMPFYNVVTGQVTFWKARPKSSLGTSLMYYRETWERTPFMTTPGDEDSHFVHAVGESNLETQSTIWQRYEQTSRDDGLMHIEPRMVARIHPKNTSGKTGARYEKATPELEAAVKACIAPSIVAQ